MSNDSAPRYGKHGAPFHLGVNPSTWYWLEHDSGDEQDGNIASAVNRRSMSRQQLESAERCLSKGL